MHRSIEVTLTPETTPAIVAALQQHDDVVSLSLAAGAACKPAGQDVLQLQVLNRGTDEVLSIIQKGSRGHAYSIATAEITAFINPARHDAVQKDVDEAIWEEIETGLRHNGRITRNYLLLMAIGGILTAVGFFADTQVQVICFISASVIAPGLEPVAKIPLGLVLGQRDSLWIGLRSSLVGYAVIVLAAMGTFLLLRALGDASAEVFLADAFLETLRHMKPKDWVLSTAAASASILMYLSYRRHVIAGPLIALVLIPAASAIGIALAIGEGALALQFAGRFGIEVLLTVFTSACFILLKQKTVHKRKPIV